MLIHSSRIRPKAWVRLSTGLVVWPALLAGGCSGDLKLEDLQAGATGALSQIPAAASSLVPKGIKPPVGTATEVYTRVARGALTCWMGAHGSLKGTHLFQAEAQPRAKGGAARIDIHERLKGKPNQPGKKVFVVSISPVGSSAVVGAENLALGEKLGEGMKADVHRWAAAEEGCFKEPILDGWAVPADGAKPAAGTGKKKTTQRRKPPKKGG
ncbi:MAG: hypothetical protein K0U74_02650 [Alphaproteobacteria bacterium]|nr:hypothetical protein [Alphaproteobacteria bacterium]